MKINSHSIPFRLLLSTLIFTNTTLDSTIRLLLCMDVVKQRVKIDEITDKPKALKLIELYEPHFTSQMEIVKIFVFPLHSNRKNIQRSWQSARYCQQDRNSNPKYCAYVQYCIRILLSTFPWFEMLHRTNFELDDCFSVSLKYCLTRSSRFEFLFLDISSFYWKTLLKKVHRYQNFKQRTWDWEWKNNDDGLSLRFIRKYNHSTGIH